MPAQKLLEDENVPYISDLVHQLGDIPLNRILLKPAPGTATEADALRLLQGPRKRICELVDGTLVEKPMSSWESILGALIIAHLHQHIQRRKLGQISSGDGLLKLIPGVIRAPDVAFISREQLRGHKPFAERIAAIVPDLAIEILSESNTPGEMKRKLKEYFLAGVRLVWIVDPVKRLTQVYTEPERCKKVRADKPLSGGAVLPSYELVLQELFDELEEE